MSSVAPAVEPVGPARTSGLSAMFEHTRYVLGENQVTAFAFGLLVVILLRRDLRPLCRARTIRSPPIPPRR